MSKTFSRLLFVWLFAVSPAFADPTCTSKQLSEAFHFMKQLEEKSPKYHGHSLRRYALEDISSEGCVDVVERINEPEEKELGLMSDALWDGFEWIKIYSFRNGKFLETTDKHYQFLIKRKNG